MYCADKLEAKKLRDYMILNYSNAAQFGETVHLSVVSLWLRDD